MYKCPECNKKIETNDNVIFKIGDLIYCPNCRHLYKVIEDNKLKPHNLWEM